MEAHEVWIPIVASIGAFTMIGFIVWVLASNRRKIEQTRADFHARMLDKFGSSSEFVAFASSPEGRDLLARGTTSPHPLHDRILRAVSRGIVLSTLGIGLILLTFSHHVSNEISVVGAILLAIGLGNLISAFVSRRLARAWGLEPNAAEHVPAES